MFYQKYRPQNFSQVFGNLSIVKALKTSISSNSLPHALIFYGPRGTGKTTTARLVAKTLVCENLQNGDACGTCDTCLQISKGSYPDVIELDAASNNSVENIRYINDKIALSPSRGKIKLYIIDEVHMLSKGAFNALLKTLEEPPKNTYFILATTEIEKVIDTIKSRCTIFEFKQASIKDLVAKLNYICKEEGVKISESDLEKIAKASRGGFRDSETLLETMVVGNLSIDEVLNSVGTDFIVRFFDACLDNNTSLAVELINNIYKSGKNLEALNKEILAYLRQILLIQNNLFNLVELDESTLSLAKNQSQLFTPSFLLKSLKVFNTSLEQLKYSYIPIMPLEIAIYELTNINLVDKEPVSKPKNPSTPPKSNPVKDTGSFINSSEGSDLNTYTKNNKESKNINVLTNEKSKNFENKTDAYTDNLDTSNFDWLQFLQIISEQKPSLLAILNVVEFKGFEGSNLIIQTKYAFHKERLEIATTKSFLIEVLSDLIGAKSNIVCTICKKQDQNLTDKNIEYVTVSESDLPVFEKKPKADDFSIPLDDESFVASSVTVEEQLKKMAKENANQPVKSSAEQALESFSGDFEV